MNKTLADFQKETAIKYGLGNSLVTGHRKTYYDEAALNFTKYQVKAALKAASENATVENKAKFKGDINYVVNEESILIAYPYENIK